MMKIFNLTEDSKKYTSNVFLVLGTWNTVNDMNTLIDVGSDTDIIQKIENINTGLGKKKIDQVVLTHSHSDHSAILPEIKQRYNPKIFAFNSFLKGIDYILADGDKIKIGEQVFEVFHISTHSYDSICLCGDSEGILFAGDTKFPIEFENDKLKNDNKEVLSRLKSKNIKQVYYGHGPVQFYFDKPFQIFGKEFTLSSGSP
jgi:glyoxylase-like metal-dependent hydrolase (beta-lactamase superfamily II)